MDRRLLGCVLLSAVVLAGCDAPSASTGESTAKVVPGSKPLAATLGDSRVTRTTTPLPARFGLPLPTTAAQIEAWRNGDDAYPPESFVADLLADGDTAMHARLAEAAAAVTPDAAEAWARGIHERLQSRLLSPAFCDATQAVLEGPPSTLRAALAGAYAQRCASADAAAMILRADTPDWAVVAWYSERYDAKPSTPLPYDARLADALRAAIARQDGSDSFRAALALAHQPDAAAADALIEIHAGLTDAKLADRIAHTMRWSPDPRAHAVGVAACKRTSTDISDCNRVFHAGRSPANARPAATRETDQQRASRQLASRLRDMGFRRVDPANASGEDDAPSLLVEAGHAYWFDVETGTFPNAHDSLLRALSELIRPRLAGVIFEEIAPQYAEDDASATEPMAHASAADEAVRVHYQLRAYVDGQLLETTAQDLGDWYDVEAVLRLLDAVLLERKANERFLVLESSDQTAIIVAADAEVLKTAIDARLLTPGDPRAAETLGKGFEQRVLRSLQEGSSDH